MWLVWAHPSLLSPLSSSQLMDLEKDGTFNSQREGWPNTVRKFSGKINFYS